MLSVHITEGVSKTPDAAKAVFEKLNNISPVFDGLGNLVEGMTIEGQSLAMVSIADFLKARESYYATMERLGLDDGPQAA